MSQWGGFYDDNLHSLYPEEKIAYLKQHQHNQTKEMKNCTPIIHDKIPCDFVDLKVDFWEKSKYNSNLPYYSLPSKDNEKEFYEWLSEFPIVTIPQGTVLIHNGLTKDFVKDKSLENLDLSKPYVPWSNVSIDQKSNAMCWWNKTFVGQGNYGGGWFTYKTTHGSPPFELAITYKLKTNLTVLFIPNDYAEKYNKEKYRFGDIKKYDEKETTDRYFSDIQLASGADPNYRGSHIVQGVKNWKQKGYKAFGQGYYADGLALRLSTLGFNGYMSCDECEVFISHGAMRTCIGRPEKIQVRTSIREYNNEEARKNIDRIFRTLVTDCDKLNIPSIELTVANPYKVRTYQDE